MSILNSIEDTIGLLCLEEKKMNLYENYEYRL